MKDQGASGDTVNWLVKESCGERKAGLCVSVLYTYTHADIHTPTCIYRWQVHCSQKDKHSHLAYAELNTAPIVWPLMILRLTFNLITADILTAELFFKWTCSQPGLEVGECSSTLLNMQCISRVGAAAFHWFLNCFLLLHIEAATR